MTLKEFYELDKNNQALAVWDGFFVGDRQEGDFNILLYQVDSFYAEVFYNKEDNEIDKIEAFDTTDRLQPYIDKINLINKLNN